MSIKCTVLLLLCALAIAITPKCAYAAPDLALPIDCTLGKDCWVANYMDVDPGQSALDHNCSAQTYDGHKGTDIAIADLMTMEKGVNVLAAADGKVLRLRNDVEDKILNRADLEKIKRAERGCGNGVYIDHGNGWQTIYCHMKKGSISVTQGQQVTKGETIGQVGYSGVVEFPHVHLGVFFKGTPIDPFTGHNDTEGCHQTPEPLWDAAANIDPAPVAIYAVGFADHIPDFEAVKVDTSSPESIRPDAKTLVFWVAIFGIRHGDHITLNIFDPLGRLFARQELVQNKTRARQFYYVGKHSHNKNLIAGTYKGKIYISRNMDKITTIQEKGFEIGVK